jgi:hypothetical protein
MAGDDPEQVFRERASIALPRSEATTRALMESASEAIVIVASDGRIVLANSGAERMFGYPREELVGQTLEMLLPERLRGSHAHHRSGYFETPRVRPMGRGLELAARRRDGTEFPVEVSLSYVDTGAGLLAMAFVTDITERKRAEAELQRQRELLHQTEKLAALGTLAAGLAHEINNPIGIVASRLELVLTDPEIGTLPGALHEDLDVIRRNVQRIGRLASGLLSFARQSPRDRHLLALNEVVEETLLLVTPQLGRTGISVHCTLDPALPRILGDPGALQQVVLNLLTNAREAMNGPGRILIETRRGPGQPEMIQLVVSDTGPGMPPEIRDRIFDPFFTTKPQGTGLGLSMSYGIVRDHGGTIEVRSVPGSGTSFVLAFPIHSSEPTASIQPP